MPLPTSVIEHRAPGGSWRRSTSRGGCGDPAPMPSRAPIPSSRRSCSSRTRTARPSRTATSRARHARSSGTSSLGGRLVSSRASSTASASSSPAVTWSPSGPSRPVSVTLSGRAAVRASPATTARTDSPAPSAPAPRPARSTRTASPGSSAAAAAAAARSRSASHPSSGPRPASSTGPPSSTGAVEPGSAVNPSHLSRPAARRLSTSSVKTPRTSGTSARPGPTATSIALPLPVTARPVSRRTSNPRRAPRTVTRRCGGRRAHPGWPRRSYGRRYALQRGAPR